MSEIRGFASAERQWENMEPEYAEECICESRYECPECGEDSYTAADLGTDCKDAACADGGPVAKVVEIEQGMPVSGCREHGWCTGCSNRYCGECN